MAATNKEVVVSLCWPSTHTRESWFKRNLPMPQEWKSFTLSLSSSFLISSARSSLISPSAILSVPWKCFICFEDGLNRCQGVTLSNLDHCLPPTFKLGLFPAVAPLEYWHYNLKPIDAKTLSFCAALCTTCEYCELKRIFPTAFLHVDHIRYIRFKLLRSLFMEVMLMWILDL